MGSLLQVPVDFLAAGVTTRTIESKKGFFFFFPFPFSFSYEFSLFFSSLLLFFSLPFTGMARGTTYKVPLNAEQAYSARDALAKGIYSLMFNWFVLFKFLNFRL